MAPQVTLLLVLLVALVGQGLGLGLGLGRQRLLGGGGQVGGRGGRGLRMAVAMPPC